MNSRFDPKLVVVGSVALDTVETPVERGKDILGGSASYACVAASFFAPVGMVAVVGDDFPASNLEFFGKMGVDTSGLRTARGKTFRWSGRYEDDMNRRRTLSTDLNVFASFSPVLTQEYKRARFMFLANIGPELQLHVLCQARNPAFVAADTMDLWIRTARDTLMKVISRVDMLILNDSEARMLTGEYSLLKGARKMLGWGPRYIAVKKGEHGAIVVSKSMVFVAPAYPVQDVRDPTGAGDTFAGALMGALAREGTVSDRVMRRAVVAGSVCASFSVERMGLDRLGNLTRREMEKRRKEFLKIINP